MSYIYLQEQEEGSWVECCSDTPPFALLKSKSIQEKSSSSGNVTESSPNSPSGTMSPPSTENHGGEKLMSCAEDSPARTFQPLAKVLASRAKEAGCGQSLQELSVKYDRDTHSWKTHQCLWEEDLPWSSVTLPKWGMMQGGVFWELTILERPIVEKEYGSWPSPTCNMVSGGPNHNSPQVIAGNHGINLHGAVLKIWPTASARDWKDTPGMSQTGTNPDGSTRNRTDQLARAVYADGGKTTPQKFPTPNARDWKGKPGPNANQRESSLPPVVGEDVKTVGKLNPDWVEWLMGWPIGWTDLKPLATDKFQQWYQQFGDC